MKNIKSFKVFEKKDQYDIQYIIDHNNIDEFKDYLDNDGDVNFILRNEDTLLEYIIRRSNIEFLKLIIHHPDLDPNYLDIYDENALIVLSNAKASKKVEILNILLSNKKLDVKNFRNMFNESIIQIYYSNINFNIYISHKITFNNLALREMILILIGEGVDLSNKNNNNRTIIDIIKDYKDIDFLNKIKSLYPKEYERYEKMMKASDFNL